MSTMFQSVKILGKTNVLYRSVLSIIRLTHSLPGSGAGKGGGHGGAIREAGGGIGRYGAAQEEGYFYNKTKEDLEKMKQKMKEDEERKQKKDDAE